MSVIASLVDHIVGAESKRADPTKLRVPTARMIYLSAAARDVETQEELERNFFSSLRLKNGTYKFTYSHRLDDLNDLVAKYLPAVRPLQLMDVAVSSGISTLEWISSLNQAGVAHHIMAGDLCVNAYLLSLGRHLHVLVDGTGYPLQFDIYGSTAPNPPGKCFSTRYFLPLLLLRTALLRNFARLRAACAKTVGSERVRHHGITCRAIALVSPRLRKSLSLDIIEDDILGNSSLQNRFHILRAANILNRTYFTDDVLRKMIINLRSRLLSGGLLILCRTNEHNANNGTIFTLNQTGRFEVTARIGAGSEIEDMVLELDA